eukprot:TRINITY_DN14812_c0_g1_i1.p1 TRINITY_DN14812_c0_g1~~TRINITY_DN14812_c0_g1_i1.p1  ORF type:complete len:269 (+),score=59.35 TRINITY_DN14812_c0_g1_i1:114-809(+)
MANEPSVGLFRIREHIERSIPTLVERKKDLKTTIDDIARVAYDIDYCRRTVANLAELSPVFASIQQHTRRAVQLANEIVSPGSGGSATSYEQPVVYHQHTPVATAAAVTQPAFPPATITATPLIPVATSAHGAILTSTATATSASTAEPLSATPPSTSPTQPLQHQQQHQHHHTPSAVAAPVTASSQDFPPAVLVDPLPEPEFTTTLEMISKPKKPSKRASRREMTFKAFD